KSPVPVTLQFAPTLPRVVTCWTAVPFISHIATLPEVSSQRTSALPSALKSPTPPTFQRAPTWPTPAASRTPRPVISQIATVPEGVEPQEVGVAVAVEVAGADDGPLRARIGQHGLRRDRGVVDEPDLRRADERVAAAVAAARVEVLEQEIGHQIAVEVVLHRG